MMWRDRLSASQLLWIAACISVLLAGCHPTLETKYADARGNSIDGVNSFVDLIKSTGWNADIWNTIAARMATDYSAVVVFVSHFNQLPEETVNHIWQLCDQDSIKAVLIVVRDSDPSIDYWTQIAEMKDLTEVEIDEAREELDAAIADLKSRTASAFDVEQGVWYGLQTALRVTEPQLRTIEFSEDGAATLNARWSLNRRLVPGDDTRVLWKSQDNPLLTRERTGKSDGDGIRDADP